MDLPEVDGCVGRVWDEHTCGVHHSSSADDHGMQARQAEEGSSTTPLVMGATDGPGRQRCNWFRQVTVRSKSHPAVRQRGTQESNWATRQPSCSVTLFSCGEYLCWVHSDGILCVPWFSFNPSSQDLRRRGHVQRALVSSSIGNDLH